MIYQQVAQRMKSELHSYLNVVPKSSPITNLDFGIFKERNYQEEQAALRWG
jgi:hypothetical protein